MKRIAVFFAAAAYLLLLSGAAFAQEMRVDFYDMGKADAMLITMPDGTRTLIDAGTNKGGKKLVERFEKEGIDHIDTMIITHYDKDHVGGADKVLEEIDVSAVIMPRYDKESKQHTQFLEALEECGVGDVTHMEIGSSLRYEAGGVSVYITAAHEHFYGHDEENDFSLVTRMVYGDTRFLFAGDAEVPRQLELMREGEIACDVLKVPYHGRMVASSEAFIRETGPKIAYITDDEEEPASETLIRLLREQGAEVYCAKDDGSIAVISDGKSVRVQ